MRRGELACHGAMGRVGTILQHVRLLRSAAVTATHMLLARALQAADNVLLTKEAICSVAARHGLVTSFLPKLLDGQAGSGMHCHLSLWRGDESCNRVGAGRHGLAPESEAFLAGVLAHLPALACLTTPSPNSFRRVPGCRPTSCSGGGRTTPLPALFFTWGCRSAWEQAHPASVLERSLPVLGIRQQGGGAASGRPWHAWHRPKLRTQGVAQLCSAARAQYRKIRQPLLHAC